MRTFISSFAAIVALIIVTVALASSGSVFVNAQAATASASGGAGGSGAGGSGSGSGSSSITADVAVAGTSPVTGLYKFVYKYYDGSSSCSGDILTVTFPSLDQTTCFNFTDQSGDNHYVKLECTTTIGGMKLYNTNCALPQASFSSTAADTCLTIGSEGSGYLQSDIGGKCGRNADGTEGKGPSVAANAGAISAVATVIVSALMMMMF